MSSEVCTQFVSRALSNWNASDQKIKNPETGRPITIYKQTFKDLAQRCSMYNNCSMIHGLRNVNGFTCYLDSVLMVLFAVQNKLIDRYILDMTLDNDNVGQAVCDQDPQKNHAAIQKIQDELRRITFLIRNGEYVSFSHRVCTNLLKRLRRHCKRYLGTVYARFYEPVQNSASDFLAFILNVFGFSEKMHITLCTENAFKKRSTDARVAYRTKVINRDVSCLWVVPSDDLNKKRYLRSLLRQYSQTVLEQSQALYRDSDKKKENPMLYYERTVYWERLPPFFVMELSRVDLVSRKFIHTPIIPNISIGRRKLFGIVVHLGYVEPDDDNNSPTGTLVGSGHYVAYLKCKNEWFRYDDLRSKLRKIGGHKDLVQRSEVVNNGILFFYSL